MKRRRTARWRATGRRFRTALAASGLLCALVTSRSAAQVVQLEGGGSTLYDGYGGAVNLWSPRVEGGIGLGWLDGFRLGMFARGAIGARDTLRLGNDAIPVRFPTDLFGGANALLVQGASVQRTTRRTRARVFAGAFALPLASPSFITAARAEQAMGLVQVEHELRPELALSTHAVLSTTQTLLQGVRWRRDDGLELAANAGVGANDPYGAASVHWRSPRLELRASYVHQGDDFRRAGVPSPVQAEADRENVVVTYRLRPALVLGAGRQNFHQDSVLPGTAPRATLNQLFASGQWSGTRLNGGLFEATSGGTRNLSAYVDASRDIARWLQGELYVLQVWQPSGARSTTPMLFVREFLTPRLTLLQVISHVRDRTTVSFGGSFTSGLLALGVDYQVVHTPFRPQEPFAQALSLTARVQLGTYQVNASSFVAPDGRVNYTGSGSTYLYLDDAGAPGRRAGAVRLGRHLLRGRVVDEAGAPVEGAAILLGEELVITDSRGEFFLRRNDAKPARLSMAFDEFLAVGRFELVRAPETVVPERESRARTIEIVLRRLPSR